jgi:hypothetical protein
MRTRRRLRASGLGLLLAAMCAGGAHGQAAFGYTDAHGVTATPPAKATAYPNHRPLSGNYPGSYPSAAAALRPNHSFDWRAAGVGASGMLALILLLAASTRGLRSARESAFVLEVRDDRPGTG